MLEFVFTCPAMYFHQPAQRRLAVLCRVLSHSQVIQPNAVSAISVRYSSDQKSISIGDVTKLIKSPKYPQYVPRLYLKGELSQEVLRHLRWMLQKDLLGQDMFLIGRPGPLRRQLAMQFLEMTARELEYVSLSRDTTESDLKQRREIKGGTAKYFDQCAVRAAVEGRILILEGIEKAERNVLPVLNNLLENREMHLEDGRFLIPAKRYDKLLEEHSREDLDRWNLVRVSEDFRVIALGLPVPRYFGNPLDPPLRSRFQARDVHSLSFKEQLNELRSLAPGLNPAQVSQLLSCCHALLSPESSSLGLPDFPADSLPAAIKLLDSVPGLSGYDALYRLYPYQSFMGREGQEAVESVLSNFQLLREKDHPPPRLSLRDVVPERSIGSAQVRVTYETQDTALKVPCGSGERSSSTSRYVPTAYQERLLVELMLTHQLGDMCIIGPRGCGKSATVRRLADLLNYQVEPIVLYQDMTSRDLIQQRTTLPNGDTVWRNSPLVTAALEGKLAILDGIHRIHPSTLSIIHRLVHDRELQLYDGRRLVRHDRYDDCKMEYKLVDQQMEDLRILRIHPAFRIVALAEPPVQGSSLTQWLSSEMLSLFLFHEMRPLALQEEMEIVKHLFGQTDSSFPKVMEIAHQMRDSEDPTLRSLSGSLSTRQLLRIARRMASYPADNPGDIIHRACLTRFLPTLARQALDNILTNAGIDCQLTQHEPVSPVCRVDGDTLTIGKTTAHRYQTSNKTKVPDILFYDVPQHVNTLEWLLQDFCLGEHLLLVGNQGVGKNKLADRLLQLLNRPREYIQLHRDTTVQTLTLQPTVRDGVVIYEDSPLVQAVKHGHVLVVDEADKAPTHVTCILKTLVESGEMILSDGRRIVPHSDPRVKIASSQIIPMHPDFRMIVLANRPGFPFLGNDFFGALGDLFSCHAVDNPSPESELSLLKQYGPDVPDKIIRRLVKAFGELRNMADQGLVQYPYSTREVVNIVKHLQEFPNEGLGNVVGNVFDFDSYTQEVQETLIQTLHKHGIPIRGNPANVKLAKEVPLPAVQLAAEWTITHPSPSVQLAVEERFLKTKPSIALRRQQHPLDRVEARSAIFSEMQSYWTIPMPESSIVVALAAGKSAENDQLKDWIHVLTSNPLRLYTMQPNGDKIQELSFQGLFSPPRGSRPCFTLAPLVSNGSSLLVHEESSNTLLLVDTSAGKVHPIPLLSTLEQATDSLARTLKLGSNKEGWCMLSSLLGQTNQVVLFEHGGSKIDVIDIEAMKAYSTSLPSSIRMIHIASAEKWLVEDTDSRKYVLSKLVPTDPCPSLLLPVEERGNSGPKLTHLAACDLSGLHPGALSQALEQKMEVPNRILSSEYYSAILAVGFPDLELSKNEIFAWPRPQGRSTKDSLGKTIILADCGQILRPVQNSHVPPEVLPPDNKVNSDVAAYLEVTDLLNHKLRYIPIPQPQTVSPLTAWLYSNNELPVLLAPTSNYGIVTADPSGCIRLWETELVNLEKSLVEWRQMIGTTDREYLQMTVDRPSGLDVTAPKHGKVDETGAPHVGGNTWAGGTGGRDTAGLGGKGGPYRLDAGHTVHQVSQEEKDAVPEHVKKAAREMGQKAFKQRLKEIQMSDYDAQLYGQFSDAVNKQVQALRVILGNLQAKSKERQWMRHQTAGELDDTKLIEGLTGEKTIYRRRAEKEPELGSPQTKPKRLKLVVDVSGSMYRFNSYDGRLDRELEAVVMVMEAFQGHEAQIQYDIVGHSGEDYNLVFVDHKSPPVNNKQRLEIIKTMHAHSQFCMSGDHTLAATHHAITTLRREDCDEAIIIVLSDANLERYGIAPENFAKILTSDPEVNAYAIFIGSLGDQAARLTQKLPAGRAFVCLDLKNIPQILQQIFAASVLNTR